MNKAKKGLILSIISLFVTTAFFVYGSVAYFSDREVSYGNFIGATGYLDVALKDLTQTESGEFEPTQSIKIAPGELVAKNVSIKNTGTTPVYVRVKFDVKITLSELQVGREDEIDISLIDLNVNETTWTYKDGYYFYNDALDGGEETENALSGILFSRDMGNLYKDSVVTIKTRIETVQASNNGETVFDATGWVTSSAAQGGVA